MVYLEEAKTHVLSHTLHYGTGVFEGIRCYNTPRGPAIFRLEEHVQRLFDSAEIMKIQIPFSKKEITGACREIVRKNNLDECYIRPLVFLGRKHLSLDTHGIPVECIVAAWEWGSYLGEEGVKNGIRAMLSPYARVFPHPAVCRAKAVANYTASTLAKMDAGKKGFDEAVMLDQNGFVAECTGENIFTVKNGRIFTPPPESALAGITRESVMEISANEKIAVEEKFFGTDFLLGADEVFITGTAAEIVPIREIGGAQIGSGKPGPVTKKLQEIYFGAVRGKEKKYEKWLDYLNR